MNREFLPSFPAGILFSFLLLDNQMAKRRVQADNYSQIKVGIFLLPVRLLVSYWEFL
jgi:hypothetical protein